MQKKRDESHILVHVCVVLKMDDLDLGGSIRAGPDLCDLARLRGRSPKNV